MRNLKVIVGLAGCMSTDKKAMGGIRLVRAPVKSSEHRIE